MYILDIIPFILGGSLITNVFLLMFVFGILFKLIRG